MPGAKNLLNDQEILTELEAMHFQILNFVTTGELFSSATRRAEFLTFSSSDI
jgi:hypothetical protein